MVMVGQDGNAQALINAGAQGSGALVDQNTGLLIQNVGGQVANAGGQVQNGNYVDVIGSSANATGLAVGGQAGSNIAFGG